MKIEDLFGNLTEEQIAKAKQCKDPAEFLELVGAEGIDLTDEQMGALSGGWSPSQGEGGEYDGETTYHPGAPSKKDLGL